MRRKNGRPKSPKSIRAKLLRVLGSTDIPIPTPDLAVLCAFNSKNARVVVGVLLRRLAAAGQVRQVVPACGKWKLGVAVRWELA